MILYGWDAIHYAEKTGAPLNKYQDAAEPAKLGLSLEEAYAVATEDSALIWVVACDNANEEDA